MFRSCFWEAASNRARSRFSKSVMWCRIWENAIDCNEHLYKIQPSFTTTVTEKTKKDMLQHRMRSSQATQGKWITDIKRSRNTRQEHSNLPTRKIPLQYSWRFPTATCKPLLEVPLLPWRMATAPIVSTSTIEPTKRHVLITASILFIKGSVSKTAIESVSQSVRLLGPFVWL